MTTIPPSGANTNNRSTTLASGTGALKKAIDSTSTNNDSEEISKVGRKKTESEKPIDDKAGTQAQGNAVIKKGAKLSASGITPGVTNTNDWSKKGATPESSKGEDSKTGSNASINSAPSGLNSAHQSVSSMSNKELQNTFAIDDPSKLLGNPAKVPTNTVATGSTDALAPASPANVANSPLNSAFGLGGGGNNFGQINNNFGGIQAVNNGMQLEHHENILNPQSSEPISTQQPREDEDKRALLFQ